MNAIMTIEALHRWQEAKMSDIELELACYRLTDKTDGPRVCKTCKNIGKNQFCRYHGCNVDGFGVCDYYQHNDSLLLNDFNKIQRERG